MPDFFLPPLLPFCVGQTFAPCNDINELFLFTVDAVGEREAELERVRQEVYVVRSTTEGKVDK